MNPIKRHFLGWRQPVVKQTVEVLIANRSKNRIDLQDTLVVVPTRNAARRLREALAEAAANHGAAVIPGPITPPDFLLGQQKPPKPPVASQSEITAVWSRLLQDIQLTDFPHLFPRAEEKADQTPQWALSTAKHMIKLQNELAENGLDFHSAARQLQESPEPERWNDLAELEKLFFQLLDKHNRQDPNRLKINKSLAPELPEGITKIKMFAVADPLPLSLTALEKLAGEVRVDIYIHAPAELADHFDTWGRPIPESWEAAQIPIPAPESNLVLTRGPERQAEITAGLLCEHPVPADDLAIGVPDSEVMPALEDELKSRGWQVFNPAGHPLAQHPLVELSRHLLNLFRDQSFADFAALLRHSTVSGYFLNQDPMFQANRCLESLDNLQNQNLPTSFAELKTKIEENPEHHRELQQVCQFFDQFLPADSGNESLSTPLLNVLRQLHSHLQLSARRPEDQEFRQAAEKVVATVSDIDTDLMRQLELPVEITSGIFEDSLRTACIYPERPLPAIDLQGWLELAWEDAPYLVLTGMNEHRVPASVIGDPFLPDQARTTLGLSNNRRRFARDAFLLRTMIASRQHNGRIIMTLGKHTTQGDPLKPSRLLFRCPDRELPARATQLFAEDPVQTDILKRESSWRLRIPKAEIPYKMSVTKFNDYLQCPFRFYLKHLLEMERQDDTKMELDALDFGNLCHAALEILGAEKLRGVTSQEVLKKYLLDNLNRVLNEQFGTNWPPALYFQKEALTRRLEAAARQQAELHRQGWRIIHTESRKKYLAALELEGIRITGRIDRIDRHADGSLRVLDYKTGEKTLWPQKALWRTPSPEVTKEYARVMINNREKAWADLQLPLYIMMARHNFDQPQVEAGYFNLPKDTNQTGIQLWENASAELLESARGCACGVILDIKNGRFWPPAEKVAYDQFEELFPDPVRERVDLDSFPYPIETE